MLPMDTKSSSRRALKPAQERKSLKIGNGPETRHVLQRLRNKGARKRKEVVLGTLFKLLVKEKLPYSGKVPVNAELRPLRRENRGTEV